MDNDAKTGHEEEHEWHNDSGKFKKGNPGGPGRPKGPDLAALMRRRLADEPNLAWEIVEDWIKQARERGGRDMSYLVDRACGLMVQKVEEKSTRYTKRLGWAAEIGDEGEPDEDEEPAEDGQDD